MCSFGTWAVSGRSALQELQRQWSWAGVWPSSAGQAHVKVSRVHLCRLCSDLEVLWDSVCHAFLVPQ